LAGKSLDLPVLLFARTLRRLIRQLPERAIDGVHGLTPQEALII
jgi:hypothetical protein